MTKTRLLALAFGALLLAAAPANAQHTFTGTATAVGLELLVAGQGLTIGFSEAALQSTAGAPACDAAVACAEATGAVLVQESATASAPGNPGPNSSVALTTSDTPLGDAVLLDLGIAAAEASQAADTASASANAAAADVHLTATQTLAETVPLQESLQPIVDALDPLAETAPAGTVDRIQASLQQILDGLVDAPLVSIALGPSDSTTVDTGGVTTATASAKGAVITVAPTAVSLPTAPEGLIIIEVGAASATATTDQRAASATFDPAVVRVSIFDPLTGEYDPVIEVAPGQSGCQTDGTPLEGVLDLCIAAGGGETTQDGAGAAAVAAGVSITLDLAGQDVLDLALARAEVGVNAAPPAAAPAPAPTTPPPGINLPRTGGGALVPGLVVMGLAGLSGLAVARRRTLG